MHLKPFKLLSVLFLLLLSVNICYSELPRPYTNAVFGDIDGDGDNDLVISSSSQSPGDSIRILINNNKTYFVDDTSARLSYDPEDPYVYTQKVLLADIDRDNDLDILAANSLGASTKVLINDGTGKFAQDTTSIIPFADGDSSNSAAVADIDSDNKVDYVFVANDGNLQNRLFIYNSGTGKFQDKTSTNLPSVTDYSFDTAFGDLNNDGYTDIFVANANGSGALNKVYLNDGAGSFSAADTSFFPQDTDFSTTVLVKDFSGDGKNDVFVANANSQQNKLYIFNSSSGKLEDKTSTNLPQLSDSSWGAATIDVFADSYNDIIVTNDGQDRLLINNGSGVFEDKTATNLPTDSDYSEGVAIGDVNGDGKDDIFVANFDGDNGGQNRLLINDGSGVFSDVSGDWLPYSITGKISLTGGSKAVTEVTVTLSGGTSATTNPTYTTGLNTGKYAFEEGLEKGKDYTVTPSLTGYNFTPSEKSFTSLSQDEEQDFAGAVPTYTISGTITLSGGNSSETDVVVTLSGDDDATTSPDSNGDYSFSGLEQGDYTVTPSLSGYSFDPIKKDFTALSQDSEQDFTGTSSVCITITTTTLPQMKNGKAFKATLKATGGTKPYKWVVTAGKLPAGLKLNRTTGVISGKPTKKQKYNFTVKATDSSNPKCTDEQNFKGSVK